MLKEQEPTLEGLRMAIQMEIDGREYYLKASQGSSNKLGKKLLESLAAQEDLHRGKFQEIYDAIRNKKAWPATDFRPDGGKRPRTIFARATEKMSSTIKARGDEFEAIQKAMSMENKTFDFYKSQSKKAADEMAREFYEKVAAEEREHYLVLLDYYEYLKNPAGWFVQKEHPSLDGG